MANYVRIENQGDLDWLQYHFDRLVTKVKSDITSFSDIGEIIFRLQDAVHSALPTEQAAQMGIPQGVLENDPKPEKKEAKKISKKDDYIPNICKTHPTKALQRPPRDDCKGCWAGYKKLFPLNYDRALKNFERKRYGAVL